MSGTTKVILGIIIGLVIVCLATAAGGVLLFRSAGRAIGQSLESDAGQAVEIASKIAEYQLPEDFQNVMSMDVGGFSMVAYTGTDKHSHIYFFQMPKGVHVNEEDMAGKVEVVLPDDWNGRRSKAQIVDHVQGTIAGQDVTLVITEGTNHEGQAFRQVGTSFDGKNGQTFVVFSRPTSTWDQVEVDAFLASIK
jgi:hypothetical protein